MGPLPTANRSEPAMRFLLDSMNLARTAKEQADRTDALQIPRSVGAKERRRREAVVRRMRNDPVFLELTPEAQERLLRAAMTDDWHTVLPRLPNI
jgi:hypothetical protein